MIDPWDRAITMNMQRHYGTAGKDLTVDHIRSFMEHLESPSLSYYGQRARDQVVAGLKEYIESTQTELRRCRIVKIP